MKLSRVLGSVGIVSAAALTLVACGNKGESNNAGAKDAQKFPASTPKKATKQGGSVSVALGTDTPLLGFSQMNYQLLQLTQALQLQVKNHYLTLMIITKLMTKVPQL